MEEVQDTYLRESSEQKEEEKTKKRLQHEPVILHNIDSMVKNKSYQYNNQIGMCYDSVANIRE